MLRTRVSFVLGRCAFPNLLEMSRPLNISSKSVHECKTASISGEAQFGISAGGEPNLKDHSHLISAILVKLVKCSILTLKTHFHSTTTGLLHLYGSGTNSGPICCDSTKHRNFSATTTSPSRLDVPSHLMASGTSLLRRTCRMSLQP